MRTVYVRQVDAFTTEPLQGNPAGVVLEAGGLTQEEMQAIARELNCSETAFALPSARAALRLRYFTPAIEVDLCGHATIATLHALREAGQGSGDLLVETNAGLLRMEIGADGMVWMEQAPPAFQPFTGDVEELLRLLGLRRGDLSLEIPVGIAYTGLWDLLLPLRDLSALRRAQPASEELARHNRALGVVSTHLFCFETVLAASTLQARDFSPAAGVAEDPHTGTASGALGAYLVHTGLLSAGRHVFEQGWTVGRPGLIHVEVAPQAAAVRVGGRAVTVFEAPLRLAER